MITNNGKELISKYLLGQVPQYATHISIGCGAFPLESSDVISNEQKEQMRSKEVMDFEMAKVPITSKGLIEENGVLKIAFSAELPAENRYDITEVGLWSAGRNNLAINSDSRMIFNFSEQWEKHAESIESIPLIQSIGTATDITTEEKIFSVLTNNTTLRNENRTAKKEGPRYLNQSILIRGDTSKINSGLAQITTATSNGTSITYTATHSFVQGDIITISGCSNKNFNAHAVTITSVASGTFTINKATAAGSSSGGAAWKTGSWLVDQIEEGVESTHIHLNNINLGTSFNSPSDKLKLALSLISKNAISTTPPDYVKILIEFYKNEINTNNGYAKSEIVLSANDFSGNSYNIVEIPISNLITTTDFNPAEIRTCRFFISIIEDTEALDENFYIALDGFRVDNISTVNPLYKMVGYSIVKLDGKPIVKYQNTNNYIEFRFSLGLT